MIGEAEEADIEEEVLKDAAEEAIEEDEEMELQMTSEEDATTSNFVEIPVTETYSSHNWRSKYPLVPAHPVSTEEIDNLFREG